MVFWGRRLAAFVPRWAFFLMAILVIGLVAPHPGACKDIGKKSGNLIRPLPYPFSHLITFASDVDMQTPLLAEAVHRVINEDMGLPMSDSAWVQGHQSTPSFFARMEQLNTALSGVENHPVFGFLLRQWHRGNVDVLHSWQDDNCYQLVNDFRKPLVWRDGLIHVELPAAPPEVASLTYTHLRLYFTSPPPPDLYLTLRDEAGRELVIDYAAVRDGRRVQFKAAAPYIVEVHGESSGFNLNRLRELDLHAASADKYPAPLIRLERDNFSRLSALMQLPWLEAWNIRPVLYTSHGGWTFAQNFSSNRNFIMDVKTGGKNPILAHPNVLGHLRCLANHSSSHAYLEDILHMLGVDFIWTYGESNIAVKPKRRGKPLLETIGLFYNFLRTSIDYRVDSLDEFRKDLVARLPELTNVDLSEFFCGPSSTSQHGVMVGLLTAIGLQQADAGKTMEQVWYTHFSSGDSQWQRSPEQPLTPSAVKWLRKLANYHYNFDGAVTMNRRVWTPAAGTVARYRLLKKEVQRHVAVDPGSSQVVITPWQDAVTGRTVPDPLAGTRDLHGLTIYVPDAHKTALFIGERQERVFTRNPADVSGRPSITIVDNNCPTVLLDEIPWTSWAPPEVVNATFVDCSDREGAAYGAAFASLEARIEGEASVEVQPPDLRLHNTSHLHFAYRKTNSQQPVRGVFFLELTMSNGETIVVAEGAAQGTPRQSGAGWWIPWVRSSPEWTYQTLATTGMTWGPVVAAEGSAWRRPPLPLGKVVRLKFGLSNAAPGDRVDLDGLWALRPNPNGEAPDGSKVIGGRVVSGGDQPAAGVVVEAVDTGGGRITTVTDASGYYFFPRVPRGKKLALQAVLPESVVGPVSGPLIQVTRNDVEVDIDLSRHQKGKEPHERSN